MIFLYTFINLFVLLIGKDRFKYWLNPLTVYCVVWQIALTLHQSGLMRFNELRPLTWIVIIFSELIFAFACVVGASSVRRKYVSRNYDQDSLKSQLKKYIWISLAIGGITIIINFMVIIRQYGIFLIAATTDIYHDRLEGDIDYESIPYIGSLINVALPLLAIYTKKYGFSLALLIGVVLTVMNSLTGGARAGLVFSMLIFGFAYLMADSNNIKKKGKKSYKRNILIVLVAGVFVALLSAITDARNAGTDMSYATPKYYATFGDNETFYGVVKYVSAPTGVLNEFLKNPDFQFGKNTFLPVYNFAAKLGLMERMDNYQSWYNTPAPCNVGTWLRELIEDFSFIGGIIAVFLFGFFVSRSYIVARRSNDFANKISCSILLMIIALSMFDWKLRTFGLWIAIGCGYYIGKLIEKNTVHG